MRYPCIAPTSTLLKRAETFTTRYLSHLLRCTAPPPATAPACFNARPIWRTTSSCAAVATLFRAMKTTSTPAHGAPSSRAAARMTRLQRLRKGATPSFLPAMNAQRPPGSGEGATMSEQYLQEERLPCLKRRSISCFDLMVPFMEKPPCVAARSDAGYAHRRLRPLARRAFRTARPPRDDMRARKPWHFARLRLFG